ncbi:MAG: AbrB/MazE/SpoVT family DNA-binding domain-containing protein [Clostridia bacterium]|nr:AbrB/MazE/SpoVT family DNA-binding domain-containing protein [Clostridia bacterium]
MQTEISRQIDELGRLVIPKELRKHYGFNPGDAVYFTCQDNGILIHNKNYRYERSEDDEE